MEQVSVLIVDEYPTLRRGLRELLHQTPGVKSVEEASSMEEALIAIDQAPPDVIVLDGDFLGRHPEHVVARLRDRAPRASLITICPLNRPGNRIRRLWDGVDAVVDERHLAEDLGLAVVLCVGLPRIREEEAQWCGL